MFHRLVSSKSDRDFFWILNWGLIFTGDITDVKMTENKNKTDKQKYEQTNTNKPNQTKPISTEMSLIISLKNY